MDPFELLGAEPDCSEDDLKKLYRKLMLRYHPDKAGPESKQKCQQLIAAYEMILEEREASSSVSTREYLERAFQVIVEVFRLRTKVRALAQTYDSDEHSILVLEENINRFDPLSVPQEAQSNHPNMPNETNESEPGMPGSNTPEQNETEPQTHPETPPHADGSPRTPQQPQSANSHQSRAPEPDDPPKPRLNQDWGYNRNRLGWLRRREAGLRKLKKEFDDVETALQRRKEYRRREEERRRQRERLQRAEDSQTYLDEVRREIESQRRTWSAYRPG